MFPSFLIGAQANASHQLSPLPNVCLLLYSIKRLRVGECIRRRYVMVLSTLEETNMQQSPEQKQKNVAPLPEKYRQEMAVWQQQQAEIEERLERLRERQKDLQADIELIRAMWQYLGQYKQHLEWQYQQWLWTHRKGV
jgi:predicted RNase H-like nuclease (RuvC/YqgF family)